MTTPYADAAFDYFRAGWRGVIPLPPREKTPPPSGFTGWTGIETSAEHIGAWITDAGRARGNIALHLGDGFVGLDVDAYDGKDGAAALAGLEARFGELPPTLTATSRDDGVSGIRIFRAKLPPGRVWIDQPAGTGRGIEIVHRGHRYAVVWPSIHPKTGREYGWRQPGGTVAGRAPDVSEAAELSDAWIEGISKPGEARIGTVAGHDETVGAVNGWRVGDKPCQVVASASSRALAGMARPDAEALHPTANGSIWSLVLYGHEGHVGAREALGAHLARFVAARLESGRGADESAARAEWWRMVRGAVGKLAPDEWRAECSCVPPVLPLVEAPPGFSDGVGSASLPTPGAQQKGGRWVDLGPYLDGTVAVPAPEVGESREDGKQLLYPEKWHTLIAPTETGKSLWAAWHVAAELRAGRTVIYAHFEESSPAGTLMRLADIGVPKDVIRARLRWADCSTHWQAGEFAQSLAEVRGPFPPGSKPSDRPTLLVLDGINAACGQHQWPVEKPESVTAYRQMFVAPAASLGMAVLSLGHPPKARGREDERHGFGSTAWLDEVDGVGFRLLPVKGKRIEKGKAGMAVLHVVKDRYGEVSGAGIYRESDAEGWRYLGAFVVDGSGGTTRMRLTVPRDEDEAEQATKPEDVAAERIVEFLRTKSADGSFRTQKTLEDEARAVGLGWDKKLTSMALAKLRMDGTLALAPELGTASAARLVAELPAVASAGSVET